MKIKEKIHRLPKEFYKGQLSVAFTLCLKGETPSAVYPELAHNFIEILTSVATKQDCIVPVYCFMPDHQHIILTGKSITSDLLKVIIKYKQRTGFWMSANKPNLKWQKNFYDHMIKRDESLVVQVRYVFDNPVRKNLVTFWQEYPFTDSLGCSLKNILAGIT